MAVGLVNANARRPITPGVIRYQPNRQRMRILFNCIHFVGNVKAIKTRKNTYPFLNKDALFI